MVVKYGEWETEKTQSSFETTDRELYFDYSEISPWNTCYLNRIKRVSKPTWKYFSGTMVDFHQLIMGHRFLTIFFAFWRSLSMWLGISNPFLGICVFIGMCLGCWPFGVLYVTWCVLLMIGWSFYLGIPEELINNGLYPSQGVLLGFIVYASNRGSSDADQTSQLYQLALLIPVTLLTLFVFQALGSFLIRILRVTPMFLAPALIGYAFTTVKVQSTYLFNSFDTHFVSPNDVSSDNQRFFVYCNGPDCNVTGAQFGTDLYQGISHIIFSDNWEPVIPITIGLFVTSPIACIMAWTGALIGTVSAILISPLWSTVAAHTLIFPCAITMMSVSGLYFVFSFHSVLMGAIACFFTIFTSVALNAYFEVFDLYSSAPIGAYLVIIMMCITGGAFPRILLVDLFSVTTPEDHIRRSMLSKKIIFDLRIAEYGKVPPSAFKNIENSILPILLCAYAKHGFINKIEELMKLGADPNACDYDGRCALHIACADNKVEIFNLLLKNQADVHIVDNFDNNALSSALLHGHFDLAKTIYKKGGRLRMKKSQLATMMCYMVAYDDLDRVKIWLECGADPNSTDYDNRTPLHIAYSKKNDRMIKFLSRYAPRKEKLDRWGKAPTQCYGEDVHDLEPVKDLKNLKIDHTADLMRRRYQAKPSVRHAMQIDPSILESIIRTILRTKDTTKSQALLPSLLCEMVFIHQHDLLSALIKENVIIDLNISDYDNRTPLHIACATGDLEIVKTLCWNNANINAVDRFGNSPLLEACKSKQDAICDFLLDQGAKLCLPIEMQVSELCWAVFNNDFDMIQRLVNAGINIHAGDYDGRSCLAVAFDNNNKNMMDLLRQYIDYSSVSSGSSSRSVSPEPQRKVLEVKANKGVQETALDIVEEEETPDDACAAV